MPSEKNEKPSPLHLSSKTLFQGFFDLKMERLRRHDGVERDYTSISVDWSAAVVIAQDIEGRYILNREYRPPTKQYVYGPPGGSLERGEDPMIGAQREFFEETGYWVDELFRTGCCYPLPGICNQKIYFFHAKNAVKKGEKKLDPFEFIETMLLTEAELKDLLRKEANVDAMLCTALWYKSLAAC